MKKTALARALAGLALAVILSTGTLWTGGPALAEEVLPVVEIETSKGTIVVELNADKAPVTVENFLAYTDAGFYDGTTFHRVIPDFMIQGGGMTDELKRKKTNPPIVNEAKNGLKNERGTIAMARTAAPNSATSQFFINLKYNKMLDHGTRDFGYAVFGKVTSGMDVVDAIAAVETARKGRMGDVPVETVYIKSVKRKQRE